MEKILIVEDQQVLRDQLRAGLSDEYSIVEGNDRYQALELFLTHAPKVVMLDLGLPPDPEGTSEGFRCLERMVAKRSAAKIIVLTASQDRDTAYRALACGAYDFYHKPVDLSYLKIILRRAFNLCRLEEQGRLLQDALQQSSAGIDGIAFRCAAVQELLAPLHKPGAEQVPEIDPMGFDIQAGDPGEGERTQRGAYESEISITGGHLTLREVRDRVEKSMIHAAVDNCGGNMAKASELLGVSRPALYDLMKKHGLFKGARH